MKKILSGWGSEHLKYDRKKKPPYLPSISFRTLFILSLLILCLLSSRSLSLLCSASLLALIPLKSTCEYMHTCSTVHVHDQLIYRDIVKNASSCTCTCLK